MNIHREAVNQKFGIDAWGTWKFSSSVIMLLIFLGVIGAIAIQELFGIEGFFSRSTYSWLFFGAFVLGGFAAAWKEEASTLKRSIVSGFVVFLGVFIFALIFGSYLCIRRIHEEGFDALISIAWQPRKLSYVGLSSWCLGPILGAMSWWAAFGWRKPTVNSHDSLDSHFTAAKDIRDSSEND